MEGRLLCLLPRGHICLLLLLVVGGALSQGWLRCLEATAVLGTGDVRTIIANGTGDVRTIIANGTRDVRSVGYGEVDYYDDYLDYDYDYYDGYGDVQSVTNGTRDGYGSYYKVLYLWPGEGFRGVGLQALVDNGTGTVVGTAAWFSKDRLFPAANTAAWWMLYVYMARFSDRVEFRVRLGDGGKVCDSRVTIDNLQDMEVVGYGPSRWRDTPPPAGCPYQENTDPASWRETTCTAPPPIPRPTTSSPIPRPTPSPPVTLAVAALVSVLVSVVAAVVDIILSVHIFSTLQHRVAHQNAA